MKLSSATPAACVIAVISLGLILGGCGQRGPLTLPEPQFPAPPEKSAPARP